MRPCLTRCRAGSETRRTAQRPLRVWRGLCVTFGECGESCVRVLPLGRKGPLEGRASAVLALMALPALRTLLGRSRRVFVTVVTVVKGSGGGVAQCVRVARPSTRQVRYVGGQGDKRPQ